MRRMYVDARGWKYRVMSGLGEHNYKARYQKPDHDGETGWKCVRSLPWRRTRTAAQEDLDRLAQEKGWEVLA